MNAYALSLELEKQRSRTRKVTAISLLFHALLFIWLLLYRTITPEPVALTEISWLEPEAVLPAAAAPSIEPTKPVRRTPPSPERKPEHFVRKTEKSDFAPRPQEEHAAKDVLQRKLASLERTAQRSSPKIAAIAASNISDRPSLAAVPERSDAQGGSVTLERGEVVRSQPVELSRSVKRPSSSTVKLGTVPDRAAAPATVAEAESTARRMIDGMSLIGPVADRILLSYGKPQYPDWAKSEGIEGAVDLYFIVLPNGKVKENILVQKTSGFEDFDRKAVDALLAWKFEPLDGGRTGEQWGSITFEYRLSD
jgi:TonB family protein